MALRHGMTPGVKGRVPRLLLGEQQNRRIPNRRISFEPFPATPGAKGRGMGSETSGHALPLPPRPKGRGGGERGADRVAAVPPLETGRGRSVRMQGDEGAPDFLSAPPKATRQTGRYHAPGFDPISDTSPVGLKTAPPRSIPMAIPTPTPKVLT